MLNRVSPTRVGCLKPHPALSQYHTGQGAKAEASAQISAVCASPRLVELWVASSLNENWGGGVAHWKADSSFSLEEEKAF